MIDSEKKTFKVGDKIIVKNWYSTHVYEVTRVTKTQAICGICNGEKISYKRAYKLEYEVYGNGYCYVKPIPRIEWNTNEYKVIEK